MAHSAKHASNWGWRRYWRENRLAACVPENPDSAAAIETHWRGVFAQLPAGSRVLDIATGNGVLLVIGALLPFLPVILIALAVAWWWLRRRRARRAGD